MRRIFHEISHMMDMGRYGYMGLKQTIELKIHERILSQQKNKVKETLTLIDFT